MAGRPREFTVADVAAMTGVAQSTVRWWIKRRHLTRTRRGLIDGAQLVDYLDSRGDRGQHARSRIHRQHSDLH